jgi:hypothetical protein
MTSGIAGAYIELPNELFHVRRALSRRRHHHETYTTKQSREGTAILKIFFPSGQFIGNVL